MDLTFIVIGAVAAVFLVILFCMSYLKASPDEAIVISGLRKKKKFLIGRAGIRVPFLERKDHLSMELIAIKVATADFIPTNDYINVKVDAAVTIKIGNTPEMLEKAAQHFLNQQSKDIASVALQALEGNVREIVGQMNLSSMVVDRKLFSEKVKENAEPVLEAMGLCIVSFNVQNFIDKDKVIENLGMNNVSQISKNASVAKANADSEVAVAQAEADKRANDARVAADLAIAEKNTDLTIKKAELLAQSEAKRAAAEAAFLISQQEQRKTTEITTAEANLAKLTKETEVQTQQVMLTEQKLEADVKKKADAELYAAQKAAEADLYKRQKESEAQRYAAEQEAAGIAAKGKAEASAIEAKAVAEAAGIEKKAEAMTKMGQAAMTEMIINKLPAIYGEAMKPLANVDSITMWGDSGNSKLIGDTMGALSKINASLKETLGFDISDVASGLTGGFIGGKLADAKTDAKDKPETAGKKGTDASK